MKQKTVYLAPDNKCYPTMVDGAIPKIQLDADAGKVLMHPSYEIEYLRKIADSADGWYEVDPTPEPLTEEEALTRYANTLTGASDPDLISAAETLITDRIKEDGE